MRIGIGYDVHRLVSGRVLILGGVAIDFDRGLEGHSDADVLVHAVCDSMLGAAGAGDIGEHFPDTDPAWRGIDSLAILKETANLIRGRGYEVVNIDATVAAQAPRISPFKKTMAANIAGAVGIPPGRVSVKATSTEGLGWIGRGEGIGAMAVALIERIPERDGAA